MPPRGTPGGATARRRRYVRRASTADAAGRSSAGGGIPLSTVSRRRSSLADAQVVDQGPTICASQGWAPLVRRPVGLRPARGDNPSMPSESPHTSTPEQPGLSVHEAADRAGVSVATLRRRSREWLIPHYDGTWSPGAVGHARIVARLRERGHSLQEIRRATEEGRLAF